MANIRSCCRLIALGAVATICAMPAAAGSYKYIILKPPMPPVLPGGSVEPTAINDAGQVAMSVSYGNNVYSDAFV